MGTQASSGTPTPIPAYPFLRGTHNGGEGSMGIWVHRHLEVPLPRTPALPPYLPPSLGASLYLIPLLHLLMTRHRVSKGVTT